MRWVVLIMCAWLLCQLQHACLVNWLWHPDMVIAFSAWLIVTGGQDYALPRVWLVGFMRDAVDPGSVVFHSLSALCIAVVALLFAERLQRWGVVGTALLAMCWLPSMEIGASLLSASGTPDVLNLASRSLLTACAAASLAVCLGQLPRRLSPVPPAKDPAWATLTV